MKFETINYVILLMGVFLFVFGIVVWVGKRIDLVAGEQQGVVAPSDIPRYSMLLGIGIILISLMAITYGLLTAVIGFPLYAVSIISGTLGLAGVLIIIFSKKKYFLKESDKDKSDK